jgi:hypothetical protein
MDYAIMKILNFNHSILVHNECTTRTENAPNANIGYFVMFRTPKKITAC